MTAEGTAVAVVLGLALWVCVFGALGVRVASARRRPSGEGVAFGVLLGPIGLLILALLPMGPESTVELRVNGVSFGRVPRSDADLVMRLAKEGRFGSNADVHTVLRARAASR